MRKSNASATSALRIIGGKHRGRKLPIPTLPGLRPTGDRNRETLFNWLQFELHGSTVLDAFAGTGALGLEALSRGAESATFIEPQRLASVSITQSLNILKEQHHAIVHTATFAQQAAILPSPFNGIFIDPPFQQGLWHSSFDLIEAHGLLAEGGWVYVESPRNEAVRVPSNWLQEKEKTVGQVKMQLFRHSAAQAML